MEARCGAAIEPEAVWREREETLVSLLAGELLDAVDSGSSAELLEALSRIALMDVGAAEWKEPGIGALSPEERERLELLRALAVQLRLDLHAMLMHIYQRIESSRGYLEVVRHLAGREESCQGGLWNALPGVQGPYGRHEAQPGRMQGQDLGAEQKSGEK
jgi:hypothetical protein